MVRYRIVISAVNLVEGGPLTILDNCLEAFSKLFQSNMNIEVIAIVNDKQKCLYPYIKYIELKWPKQNWLNRIYCEYIYFYKLSKRLKPDFWFSLHDISPNVIARKRAVYCHNATPFYHPSIDKIRFSYKEYLFSKLYKYLYMINMKHNDLVVVQQDWIRNEFCKLFHLDMEQIIVAYPKITLLQESKKHIESGKCIFFYPSYPRTFKNFELICEACMILNSRLVNDYEVVLTLIGDENRYAKDLYRKYGKLDNINFCGLLSYQEVCNLYEKTTCLIFPSKLETWGLPISEFAAYEKCMLVADLPYAHETASGANKVCFFDVGSPQELANKMEQVIKGNINSFIPVPLHKLNEPAASSWSELLMKLLK